MRGRPKQDEQERQQHIDLAIVAQTLTKLEAGARSINPTEICALLKVVLRIAGEKV